MAKGPPSFQFYPEDFIGGTTHLNTLEIGSYLLLLCTQWSQVSLPTDHDQLSRICKLSKEEFEVVWSAINDKFMENGDGTMQNERLQTIREQGVALRATRQSLGRKGGLAKAKAGLEQKSSKGRLKIEDRRQKKEDGRRETGNLEIGFDRFWEFVNAKVAKDGCRKRYCEAVDSLLGEQDDPHEYLRERMEAYAKSPKGNSQYAWQPLSWLRDGHYDDDVVAWQDTKDGKPKWIPKI